MTGIHENEVAAMTREALIARLTFLAPAITIDALRAVVLAAMAAPQRTLDGPALAEEQRRREDASGLAAVVGQWPGDESDAQIAEALEATS